SSETVGRATAVVETPSAEGAISRPSRIAVGVTPRGLGGSPHALSGFLLHAGKRRCDELELLRTGHQRRRELDDRIATVVCPADQPALEQLRRDEAAQQLVALGVVEALARLLVLHQLERVEVAAAAQVADDRQLEQALQRGPEDGLVLTHSLDDA